MAQCRPHAESNAGHLVGGQRNAEGETEEDQYRQLQQSGATTGKGGEGIGHEGNKKKEELFAEGHGEACEIVAGYRYTLSLDILTATRRMRMNHSRTLLLTFTLIGTLLPLGAEAAIKCWTNSDGVRECGNVIPPEYAQQESRTIDKSGITINVKERAKTKEEVAAEKAAKAEEEQRKAEEQRIRDEKKNYDRVLLATFLTEEELIASRDRKASVIDASVEVTQASIDKLQQNLDKHKREAAKYERAGKPLPERLQQDMDSVKKQISDKESYIAMREQEKKDLFAKYAADLKRFRELKGAAEPSH